VDTDVRPYADYRYDVEEGALAGTCWLGARADADGYAAECVPGGPDDPRPLLLVWGDSHAARLAVGLRALPDARFRVAQFTRDGCQPLFVDKYARCIEANRAIIERIRSLCPATVLLFSFWATPTLPDHAGTLRALDDTIAMVLSAGATRVIVVGPSVQWDGLEPTLPQNLLRLHRTRPYLRTPARMTLGLNPLAERLDRDFAAHFARRDRVHYFSAYAAQCNDHGCLTRPGDDPYDLMTWDYGHLTTSGATFVAGRMAIDAGLSDAD
jgi:hypothetical protein